MNFDLKKFLQHDFNHDAGKVSMTDVEIRRDFNLTPIRTTKQEFDGLVAAGILEPDDNGKFGLAAIFAIIQHKMKQKHDTIQDDFITPFEKAKIEDLAAKSEASNVRTQDAQLKLQMKRGELIKQSDVINVVIPLLEQVAHFIEQVDAGIDPVETKQAKRKLERHIRNATERLASK